MINFDFFRNNAFCIKLYSILQWHERFFALKRFFFLDRFMKKNNFIFPVENEIKFYLPYYKIDLIQREIVQNNNFYEFKLLNDLLLWNKGFIKAAIENSLVLDIGANIGNHTLFFLSIANAKKVFCFEPVKNTFEILKKNININNYNNKTELFNVGIGSSQGLASIKNYTQENTGMTQLSLSNNGDIPIIAIDEIPFNEPVSFIKIDVEGFELEAVKGMMKLLEKDHPTIMIEIRDHLYNDINSILKGFNYSHEIIGGAGTNGISNYLYFQEK